MCADFPASLRTYQDQLDGARCTSKKQKDHDRMCGSAGYLAGSGWKEYKQ